MTNETKEQNSPADISPDTAETTVSSNPAEGQNIPDDGQPAPQEDSAAEIPGTDSGTDETQPVPAAPSASIPDDRPVPAGRFFTALAVVGPLILFLLWIIQAIPNLLGRDQRLLHEITARLQTIYLGVDPWITEQLASHPMTDMTPVYTWFLNGLNHIPGIGALVEYLPVVIPAGVAGIAPHPELLPIGTALTSLFLVLLTWILARVTGNDRQTALASGLIMLASLACLGLPCLAGDELLGGSVLTLTSICMYLGWRKDFAPLWLLYGFALVAVSTLTIGLPGLAFPLLTSLIFLLWRGTFRRAGARDGALAFGVMLLLLCAWGSLLAFSDGGKEFLQTELDAQFFAPLRYGWELAGRDAWIIFATLAMVWLPWTLLILFLHWGHTGAFLRRAWSNRKERPGQGWLWCSLLVGIIIYALLGAVSPLLLPPLLPPLAILTAQGLLGLEAVRSRAYFLLIGVLLILLGIFYAVAALLPLLTELPPALAFVNLVPLPLCLIAPIACILFGFILLKARKLTGPAGSLLTFAILILLLAAGISGVTDPAASTQNVVQPAETPSAASPEAISGEAAEPVPMTIPLLDESAPSATPRAPEETGATTQTENTEAQAETGADPLSAPAEENPEGTETAGEEPAAAPTPEQTEPAQSAETEGASAETAGEAAAPADTEAADSAPSAGEERPAEADNNGANTSGGIGSDENGTGESAKPENAE